MPPLPSPRPLLRTSLRHLTSTAVAVAMVATTFAGAQAYDPALLNGGIGHHYTSHPTVQAQLGDPLSGEKCGFTGGSCYQQFERGAITWVPGQGTAVVRGAMYSHWVRNITSVGFPLEDEKSYGTGVATQRFQRADLVWSSATRVQPLRGALRTAFYAGGGPANLGAPVGAEYSVTGGAVQDFYSASSASRFTLSWHAATGRTHSIKGGLRAGWSVTRKIGAAVSDERGGLVRGGVYQMFTAGRAYWSPRTGGHTIHGAILSSWARGGYERGLGYPTSEEYAVTGGVAQRFEYGTLKYTMATRTVTRGGALPATSVSTTGYDAAAKKFSLGTPATGIVTAGGLKARRYANGTVYYSPGYGYVPAVTRVAATWEAITRLPGAPASAQWIDGSLHTRFTHQRLYFNARKAKVMRSDKTLGALDALVIGDSQVSERTWVGQGISANGFDLTVYREGGIGYVARNTKTDYPSYAQGVLDNHMALPQGSPAVIYVGGSGNDKWSTSAAITGRSTEVVKELKRLYPQSRIVMSGVISRSSYDYAERSRVEEALSVTARATGVRFIPMRGWIDTYKAAPYLADNVHFTDAGHAYMGSVLAPKFGAAIG